MKKATIAAALACASVAAQPATVQWTFWGLTEHSEFGSAALIPFKAVVRVDTAKILQGNGPDGPGTSYGGSSFEWMVTDTSGLPGQGGGVCWSGGEMSLERMAVQDNGFTIASGDMADCGVLVSVSGLGIGTSLHEVQDDPLTRWYDLSGPGIRYEVLMSGNRGFSAVTVSSGQQVIPEPASIALFGAGLAALVGFGARRRRGAKEGSIA